MAHRQIKDGPRASYNGSGPERLRAARFLCIAGRIASGKSTVAALLRSEFAYNTISSGAVLAGLLGMPPAGVGDRREFQRAAYAFISRPRGPQRLAKACADLASSSPDRASIDGLRQLETLTSFVNIVGPDTVALLFLHITPAFAFDRHQRRESDAVTYPQFLTMWNAPVETTVPQLEHVADVVLYNTSDRDTLEQSVRGIFT